MKGIIVMKGLTDIDEKYIQELSETSPFTKPLMKRSVIK